MTDKSWLKHQSLWSFTLGNDVHCLILLYTCLSAIQVFAHMKLAKRMLSTSQAHHSSAEIGESCDSDDYSEVTCGEQHTNCLPSLEQGLACSSNPQRRSATHHVPNISKEAPPSTITADNPFNPSLPRFLSGSNSKLSPDIPSLYCHNRTHSRSQAMSQTRTKHARPSRSRSSTSHMNGVEKTHNWTHSPQGFAQNINGPKLPNFWGETVSGICSAGNDHLFDMVGDKGLSWEPTTGTDVQDHGAFGQKLPVTAWLKDDFDPNFDFDALGGPLTASEFLTCMPKDLSNPASGLDATPSVYNTHKHSAGTGNNLRSVFSPVSKCLLSSMTSQGTSRSIKSHSEQMPTCMISALDILQALHVPPTVCLYESDGNSMPNCRQPRRIDLVLSSNRDTILLVSRMLKCACSMSSQLQLLLTIVCGKLITWYRATLRNDLNSGGNPSTVRSIANGRTEDEEHTERVLCQPITVGDYSLDLTLESKIRAQIVSSELQQVESLVENLVRRFQDANFENLHSASGVRNGSISAAGPSLLTPDDTGLAKAIHQNLSILLHNQLQITKAEAASILSHKCN